MEDNSDTVAFDIPDDTSKLPEPDFSRPTPPSGDDAFVFEDLKAARTTDETGTATDDWITAGNTTRTINLGGSDDCLVIIWDDTTAPEPNVTVSRNSNSPRIARVALDGIEVAIVVGRRKLKPRDVVLIPQSSAATGPLSAL